MTSTEIWTELKGQAGTLMISLVIIWAFLYNRVYTRGAVKELQAAWEKTFEVYQKQVERERVEAREREAAKDRLLQLSHEEMIQTSKIQSRLVEMSLGQRQEAEVESARRSARRPRGDEDE